MGNINVSELLLVYRFYTRITDVANGNRKLDIFYPSLGFRFNVACIICRNDNQVKFNANCISVIIYRLQLLKLFICSRINHYSLGTCLVDESETDVLQHCYINAAIGVASNNLTGHRCIKEGGLGGAKGCERGHHFIWAYLLCNKFRIIIVVKCCNYLVDKLFFFIYPVIIYSENRFVLSRISDKRLYSITR